MNRNMRKFLLSLGITVVMLPLGAGACLEGGPGDDAGVGECSVDTDCDGDIARCNTDLNGGTCEDDCNAEGGAVCGGDRPDCPADGFFCVCNADSCADGEVCNDTTGLCEEADGCVDDTGCEDDEICDTGTGECLCETVGTERTDGTVCGVDGAWEAPCVDSDCYETPAIELCQLDDTDAAYNQCVNAEDLTGDCTSGDAAPAQSGTTPVVWEVSTLIAPEADACNPAGTDLPVRSFFIGVYSTVDLTGLTAQDVLFRAGFAAGNNKFYQEAGVYDTEVFQLTDDNDDPIDDEYYFLAYICGTPADDPAAYVDLSGDGGGVSNAYCFDAEAAP
jgi:hypothetical protein